MVNFNNQVHLILFCQTCPPQFIHYKNKNWTESINLLFLTVIFLLESLHHSHKKVAVPIQLITTKRISVIVLGGVFLQFFPSKVWTWWGAPSLKPPSGQIAVPSDEDPPSERIIKLLSSSTRLLERWVLIITGLNTRWLYPGRRSLQMQNWLQEFSHKECQD